MSFLDSILKAEDDKYYQKENQAYILACKVSEVIQHVVFNLPPSRKVSDPRQAIRVLASFGKRPERSDSRMVCFAAAVIQTSLQLYLRFYLHGSPWRLRCCVASERLRRA